MDDFSNRCRQRFISEKYFRWLAGLLNEHIALWEHTLPANGSEMQKRTTSALAPGRYLPDTA
ncbi:hypothetical protein WS70_26180 [Burkholderia mayonis]|uniref:Uncharacterized protein n=2 Tax=Burkholderiaceae TaxID=119060 RepID=A0A1B4FNE8_9BURK|nr:hypothetical protein WS70_26180 [Burkholderia mayonis]KVE37058.1 hypothetical protein WS69_02570 [Burkholderia sp. BDU5]KVE44914.1 hypothetical protein WS70_06105 [Burkholderia mayonis]